MQSSIIIDQFAYVRAYAPHFPQEDRTDTASEIGRLLQMMKKYATRARSAAVQQWLTLSLREVEEALEAYGRGEEENGEALLSSAVEHFKSAAAGKAVRASFTAAIDGTIEKT